MIGPRWRKVRADIFSNKARTLLVALSIAVGVFAVGMIMTADLIVGHDLYAGYAATNPPDIAISADPFDDDLVRAVQNVPGVARAEGRSALGGRIQAHPGDWRPVQVTGIPRGADMQIERLRLTQPAGGSPALGDRQVWIERSSLGIAPLTVGSTVTIMLPDRRVRELRVAGVVYDASNPPANFTGSVSLFANPATMEWLNGSQAYSRLLVRISDRTADPAQVKAIAEAVKDKVQKSGREVGFTSITQPGQHPVGNIIQTFLAVLGILGFLTVALSAFLVVNTINALLGQHIRQIGVMKAVGAHNGQIVAMYAFLVLGFGLLALVIAAPLAALAGYGLAAFLASFLDFDLLGFRLFPSVLIVEMTVALLLPLLASLWPVLNGARVTVREAINSYGLSSQFGLSLPDRVLSGIHFLSRPLLLSLRNTFRRKARLALTLSTLTLAGAIFIAVLNLQASFDIVIKQALGYFLADVNIALARPYPIGQIEQTIAAVPGVARVESWAQMSGEILSRDEATAEEILIFAPPGGSRLIQPVVTAGRWLLPDDQNAIVIDNHLLKKRPDLQVGDDVVLKLGTRKYTWHIVGFYELPGNIDPPPVYANREYLGQLLDRVSTGSAFRVVTTGPDAATEARVAQAIQAELERNGVQIGNITTGAQQRQAQNSSTNIIIYFLLVMALLIALVGGLGLMGTMTINVLERTREIGVMRAIGAANRSIMALVIVEGMIIGLTGWLLAALLAFPITALMDNAVGRAFVQVPVAFAISTPGFVLWLALVLAIAALASTVPARSATRVSVRQALAYE